MADKVDAVGSALAQFELAPAGADGHALVGIFGKNRWEWSCAQLALWSQSVVSVPLYDTLGASAVAYIVAQTGMSTVFCSKVETAKLLAYRTAAAAGSDAAFASLRYIIQFEDASEAGKAAAAADGVTLRSFKELEDAGRLNPRAHKAPAPTDYAIICYTSGTTGQPKGAIITHGNMVADAGNAVFSGLNISAADIHLSYLPMAHVFEQLVACALSMVGAAVGFYQGDTLKILDDIGALRPTIFPSVPRLFNRIYDKIMVRQALRALHSGHTAALLFHTSVASSRLPPRPPSSRARAASRPPAASRRCSSRRPLPTSSTTSRPTRTSTRCGTGSSSRPLRGAWGWTAAA